jgi:kynurenine formamidase
MSDPVDAQTVQDWGRLYSNWGRWGDEDELGTLNFITPERVLAAAALPRSGRVVSCALPFDPTGLPAQTGAHPAVRDPGAGPAPGGAAGPRGAHWDALARVAYDGRVYNDRREGDLPTHGARAASIDRLCDGVVGRGVLLDLPRFVHRPWLDDGTRILPPDLDACAESSGVTIEPGDILLVRTGRITRCYAEGSWNGYGGGPAPGLSVRCARWLHERQVAAVASDTWCVEVVPAETRDCTMPLHRIAVRDMGLLFGESFHLDRLAEACAADGNYAFLFAAAPLPAAAGRGSPINPIAIK